MIVIAGGKAEVRRRCEGFRLMAQSGPIPPAEVMISNASKPDYADSL
ncbi:hypothetical protein LY39_03525 [Roseinatronobacter bogoriensis subsp. barguzinensis]|nr:hypothetical protein [Rhodobaca bogoriensis DSM 18756]TDW33692.1 hypothetical protein LY39_03525 [Rhodobaca barguzinensis]TDY66162.1 hypothetical protein EV660_11315 [Rhodobaca bogoriensis DSM 18756]